MAAFLIVRQDQLDRFEDDDKRLIRQMIDVTTAADLIERGLCKQGGEYCGWTLFKTVQSKNSPDIPFNTTIHSPVWKLIGAQNQGRWNAVALEVKRLERTEAKVVRVYKPQEKNTRTCPICLHTTGDFSEHLTGVHFPNHDTSDEKLRLYNDLLEATAFDVDGSLPQQYNNEFMAFWKALFVNEDQRTPELNEKIKRCAKYFTDAMSGEGKACSLYVQAQDKETGRLFCNEDNITSVLHYLGKKATDEVCYFDGSTLITGRVGQEHKAAIKDTIPTYFFTALTNVPESSYEALEQCAIMALFHLDFGKKNVWNVGLEGIKDSHPFAVLDPKILVKIGFVIWHKILERFQQAVADGSFFESKELLTQLSGPDKAAKQDYLKRFGEERENNGSGRFAKKRKRQAATPAEDLSNEARPNVNSSSNDSATPINQVLHFAQHRLAELQSRGDDVSREEIASMTTIINLLQLD